MGRTKGHIVEARDAKILALWRESGQALNNAQLAKQIGCSRHQVQAAFRRAQIFRHSKYGGGRVSNRQPKPAPVESSPRPPAAAPPAAAPPAAAPPEPADSDPAPRATADTDEAFRRWQEQSPSDDTGSLQAAFEAGWLAREAVADPAILATEAARFFGEQARAAAADNDVASAASHYRQLLTATDKVGRHRPAEEQAGPRIEPSQIAEEGHRALGRLQQLAQRLTAERAEVVQGLLSWAKEARGWDPIDVAIHVLRGLGDLPKDESDEMHCAEHFVHD
jgi:hypothetical protein